jgi:hypothetical protein
MNYILQNLEDEFQRAGELKVEMPIRIARLMDRLILLDKEIVRLSRGRGIIQKLKKWLLIFNASYNAALLSFFYQKYGGVFSFYAINKYRISEVHREKTSEDIGIIKFKRREG